MTIKAILILIHQRGCFFNQSGFKFASQDQRQHFSSPDWLISANLQNAFKYSHLR